MSVSFDRCDVTQSIGAAGNTELLPLIGGSRMFVFAYVCNETFLAAQASGMVFYEELARAADGNTFFLFLDVQQVRRH